MAPRPVGARKIEPPPENPGIPEKAGVLLPCREPGGSWQLDGVVTSVSEAISERLSQSKTSLTASKGGDGSRAEAEGGAETIAGGRACCLTRHSKTSAIWLFRSKMSFACLLCLVHLLLLKGDREWLRVRWAGTCAQGIPCDGLEGSFHPKRN
ncbi:UNVERIFIED_CONTAM: hypothetical protein FKN15_069193 [Acipenser sinensis]